MTSEISSTNLAAARSLCCLFLVTGAALLTGCASSGSSAAHGYEIRIRYAQVVDVERVPLPSAAPAGAMVGGFTGMVIARDKSPGRQLATGIGGAVLGGLATRALEGDRRGYGYKLRFANNETSQFISEKGYLQIGDCVSVERGQYANIRRVASTLCENAPATAIDDSHVREAQQCHAAKDQLLAATSDQDIESASRKVSILCQ